MTQVTKTPYRGNYAFGVLLLIVVAIRTVILYSGYQGLVFSVALLAIFALLYILEPILSPHLRWPWHPYLAIQAGLIVVLGIQRPYLDVNGTLYILLSVQAVRSLPRKSAFAWNILFILLLTGTMILGSGPVSGLVISMLIVAIGIFMVNYDAHYAQVRADQAESQVLLARLLDAHQKLEEVASQAEELVAVSERNRLARELHDSVGQTIFSATLAARSAQLLMEKEPQRVTGQLGRLQEMTATALSQLRSLITQMRPQH
jgi:signal transduction histidine kinase